MNELMMLDVNKTAAEKAAELHGKVLAARDQVSDALCTFAMHLKAMRDDRLYRELGYDDFDSYVEMGVNISKRQVYNYISTYEKLGSTVLQSNAQLGITKLQLLTQVPDIERADFVEQNDLEGMSVADIKAIIKEHNEQGEQITMLQTQIKELESLPIEDDQIDAMHKEIEEKLKSQQSRALAKEQKQLRKEYEAKVAAIEAKHIDDMEQLRCKMETAQQQQFENTKLSEITSDADMITANFYIESISDGYNKLIDLINNIDRIDSDKAQKLTQALLKMLEYISKDLQGIF